MDKPLGFWDFMHLEFDKLLLVFMVLVFVGVWLVTRNGDFAIRVIDNLDGALVGIITGAKIQELRSKSSAPTV